MTTALNDPRTGAKLTYREVSAIISTLAASRLGEHQIPLLALPGVPKGNERFSGTIEISGFSGCAIFLNELRNGVVDEVLGQRGRIDFLRGHELAVARIKVGIHEVPQCVPVRSIQARTIHIAFR